MSIKRKNNIENKNNKNKKNNKIKSNNSIVNGEIKVQDMVNYVEKTFKGYNDDRRLKDVLKLSQMEVNLYVFNKFIVYFKKLIIFLFLLVFLSGFYFILKRPEDGLGSSLSDVFIALYVYLIFVSPFLYSDIKKSGFYERYKENKRG